MISVTSVLAAAILVLPSSSNHKVVFCLQVQSDYDEQFASRGRSLVIKHSHWTINNFKPNSHWQVNRRPPQYQEATEKLNTQVFLIFELKPLKNSTFSTLREKSNEKIGGFYFTALSECWS